MNIDTAQKYLDISTLEENLSSLADASIAHFTMPPSFEKLAQYSRSDLPRRLPVLWKVVTLVRTSTIGISIFLFQDYVRVYGPLFWKSSIPHAQYHLMLRVTSLGVSSLFAVFVKMVEKLSLSTQEIARKALCLQWKFIFDETAAHLELQRLQAKEAGDEKKLAYYNAIAQKILQNMHHIHLHIAETSNDCLSPKDIASIPIELNALCEEIVHEQERVEDVNAR